MDILTPIIIVIISALVHASFQLSVSVLTLLSSHAKGQAKSKNNILRMTSSFVLGTGVMTLLVLSFISLVFLHGLKHGISIEVWAIMCGLLIGLGVAVWLFYYRRKGASTELWIPRIFAKHLASRSKATSDSAEAFSLGLTSVLAEIIFIVPCIAVAALVLIGLPSLWQLLGIAIYTAVSLLGLVIVWLVLCTGKSVVSVQKWREKNKHFLQFTAGGVLIALGCFIYVNNVIGVVVGSQ